MNRIAADRHRLARGRLLLELQAIERGVAPTLAQQLVVPAGFDDQSALDHENAIGMHDGGETVGDHNRRAPLAQFGDRLLDVALGFGVERRRSLVEQDGASLISARATAMRWRWPPESCNPCSPTCAS